MVNGLFEAVHGVYAAGSVASYFDPIMGRRRIATHDHCVNSGLYAGESWRFANGDWDGLTGLLLESIHRTRILMLDCILPY